MSSSLVQTEAQLVAIHASQLQTQAELAHRRHEQENFYCGSCSRRSPRNPWDRCQCKPHLHLYYRLAQQYLELLVAVAVLVRLVPSDCARRDADPLEEQD